MVIVLENGDLQLEHKENSEIQSPMRSVNVGLLFLNIIPMFDKVA